MVCIRAAFEYSEIGVGATERLAQESTFLVVNLCRECSQFMTPCNAVRFPLWHLYTLSFSMGAVSMRARGSYRYLTRNPTAAPSAPGETLKGEKRGRATWLLLLGHWEY